MLTAREADGIKKANRPRRNWKNGYRYCRVIIGGGVVEWKRIQWWTERGYSEETEGDEIDRRRSLNKEIVEN